MAPVLFVDWCDASADLRDAVAWLPCPLWTRVMLGSTRVTLGATRVTLVTTRVTFRVTLSPRAYACRGLA